MESTNALQTALDLVKPWVVETRTPEANRLDAVILSTNLFSAVSALVKAHWGYLSAITGLDTMNLAAAPAAGGAAAGGAAAGDEAAAQPPVMEALYHFCQGAQIFTIRVSIQRQNPIIPSICGVLPSASLYERELMELFGIEIMGTPNTDRLLLADDWPAGVFPMRKDFKGFDTEIDKAPETKLSQNVTSQ